MGAALRRGLLATRLAAPAGLEIAGRCLPAAGYVIGSDWYDVIPLPGGRTGLIVGDVLGHGPVATAVMAQLRGAARALRVRPGPDQAAARRRPRPVHRRLGRNPHSHL